MWYMNENGNLEQPAALDTESSKKFVYVRKDFEEVPKSGSGGKCDLSTTTGDIKIEIE